MTLLQRNIFLLVSLILTTTCALAQTENQKLDSTAEQFWSRFREVVAKNDKKLVASMVKFPLQMPYGVKSIKSSGELIRKYGTIFDRETMTCFTTATPQPEEKGTFTISCGEAMLYWFGKVKGEYRLTGVDNVNE